MSTIFPELWVLYFPDVGNILPELRVLYFPNCGYYISRTVGTIFPELWVLHFPDVDTIFARESVWWSRWAEMTDDSIISARPRSLPPVIPLLN